MISASCSILFLSPMHTAIPTPERLILPQEFSIVENSLPSLKKLLLSSLENVYVYPINSDISSVVFFSDANFVIDLITCLFSSSFSSDGTLHLPSSLRLTPDDFSSEKHASLFQVNPSINGWDVNASASARGLVSLPTNNKSKSISTKPSSLAVFAISKFLPVNDFLSPWSCLSPNAATTANADKSEFLSSNTSDARYAIPPAQMSSPPLIPYFQEFMTFGLSNSSSGIWWWSKTIQLSPNVLSNSFAKPPPRSVTTWKSLESVLNDSRTFLLNSFDVLTVQLAPALIRAFVIILPEASPSQSMCVVIEIDFFDFTQSIILSLKNESVSSSNFVITLVEQPRIYTSMFYQFFQFFCSRLIVCELLLQLIPKILRFCYLLYFLWGVSEDPLLF